MATVIKSGKATSGPDFAIARHQLKNTNTDSLAEDADERKARNLWNVGVTTSATIDGSDFCHPSG